MNVYITLGKRYFDIFFLKSFFNPDSVFFMLSLRFHPRIKIMAGFLGPEYVGILDLRVHWVFAPWDRGCGRYP